MVRFFISAVHWGGSISRRPFGPARLVRGCDPLKRSAEPLAGWPRNFKMAFRLLMGWAVSSSVMRQWIDLVGDQGDNAWVACDTEIPPPLFVLILLTPGVGEREGNYLFSLANVANVANVANGVQVQCVARGDIRDQSVEWFRDGGGLVVVCVDKSGKWRCISCLSPHAGGDVLRRRIAACTIHIQVCNFGQKTTAPSMHWSGSPDAGSVRLQVWWWQTWLIQWW